VETNLSLLFGFAALLVQKLWLKNHKIGNFTTKHW